MLPDFLSLLYPKAMNCLDPNYEIQITIRLVPSGLDYADHLVFFVNRQEVLMVTLHEGFTIDVVAEGRYGTTPKPIDPTSPVAWNADTAGVISIAPVAGTNTAKIGYVSPGSIKLTAKADGDLSAAVKDIFGTLDITTVAAMADHLELKAGIEVSVP